MSDIPEADRDSSPGTEPGLSPASSSALTTSADRHCSEHQTSDEAVISVVEETARIEKRAVETGRVRVSTHTDTVEQKLHETLRGDAVGVTRVPINRTIAEGEPAPQVRDEDGVTIISVLEEV